MSTPSSSTMSLEPGWPTTSTTSTPASLIHSNPPAFNLVSAILTTFELDEISTADEGDAIRRYIINQGMINGEDVVQRGVMFWVYPTGGKGPYEELEEDGSILMHGLLVTIERGALFEGMVKAIMSDLPEGGIGHIHFPRQVDLSAAQAVATRVGCDEVPEETDEEWS